MTADMDAVKSFNAELSSLYEVKPPISKAKMTALTRGAIKAIKFYKHVVQSVEKFILKCKPEYKVPGLYVIDSIVRQSRHQFGTDKDVFAPRFAKNMQQTFLNLFKCPPEDKSKIIRVLNLWQKNQVFAPDVVQPLFDLADPNHPIHKELQQQNNGTTSQGNAMKGSPALQKTPTKTSATADPAALAQLGNIANNTSTLDPNTLAQLQQLHRLLLRQQEAASKPEGGQPVHFDRKLLDFDYGSDEDDDPTNPSPKPNTNNTAIDSVGSLLSNPEVLRQLQTLQQSMITNQSAHTEYDMDKLRKLQEMKQQEDEFDKHLAQTLPNYYLPSGADLSQPPPGYKSTSQPYDMQGDDNAIESEVEFVGANDNDVEVIDIDHGDSRSPSRDRYNRRRRSRSRDRNRRRRSRSRSRSRSRRHRSRSRDRNRERGREKEEEKEKDKERRKRGLPPIKKDNLSVCSTTLWVGHLSKLVHQEDLSDTFGEFGEIVSIDLIIPRGCAFIVMHRRQDAARCLTKLKSHKMQGKAITLAWAPGKGVKGKELKDYWEGDLGVSYIPYSKIKPDIDIELLEDGGMVDEDTAPNWMKERMLQGLPKPETLDLAALTALNATAASFVPMPDSAPPPVDTSQPPPHPPTGLLQPPPMQLPLVSPFQLNNRLLGMPPGLMPNVPLGVPPPSLQGALLQNQLIGLGSPFGQGLLHPQMQMPPLDKNPDAMPALPEQLLPFNIMPPQPPPLSSLPHDENMDVEMEDADKNDHKPPNDYSSSSSRSRGHDSDRQHDRNRSRDRDRESSRSSRRDRRDSRDSSRNDRRDRSNRWGDRDRRENRDGNREGSREERRDREKTLNDRLREMAGDNTFRDEKEIQPPLLERPPMFPDLDKPERFGRSRRHGPPEIEDFKPPSIDFKMPPRDFDGPPRDFEGPAREFEGPPRDFDGPSRSTFEPPPPRDFEGPPRDFDRPPIDFPGPPMDFERPPVEFEPPMGFEGPPRDFDGPPRDFEGPPRDFDGPPRDFDGPPRDFDGPPIDFDGPPMDFDGPPRNMMHPRDAMMRDRFDDRRRGPPDFFQPRDGFGGPRGRFRGPDGFAPRGHMMRPHMFHPRGPHHMRGGPRPDDDVLGPWMDAGMRPNFPPRFEPPPDFFRGPPVAFEDSPHPRHNRRHDERRRFNSRNEFDSELEPPPHPDFECPPQPEFERPQQPEFERPPQPEFEPPPQAEFERPPQPEFERPERRSRWGNSSPLEEPPQQIEEACNIEENIKMEPPHESSFEEPCVEEAVENNEVENTNEDDHRGNTTPLHDEPQEAAAADQQEECVQEEGDAEPDA